MKSIYVMSLLWVMGCNNDPSVNDVARIGWDFDYRNWTREACECDVDASSCDTTSGCTRHDLRGCNNQGSFQGAPSGLTVVNHVHVELRYPETTSLRFDQIYDCAQGDSEASLALRGMPRDLYDIRLRAYDVNDNLLYGLPDFEAVDLSTLLEKRYELNAQSGNLSIGVQYSDQGGGVCPIDTQGEAKVNSVNYTVTMNSDSTQSTSGVLEPACETGAFGDSLPTSLSIVGIPTAPNQGSTGSFVPGQYTLKVQATDSQGAVLYCGEDRARPLNPGANLSAENIELDPGACP
jgi:hypothetical protein